MACVKKAKTNNRCEVKVVTMTVRYESENLEVRRTCGSVHSSLSASARLATVGSKAAETTALNHDDAETIVRKSLCLRASMWAKGLGWMTCSTNVNCRRHRYVCEPKMLTGSNQNGVQPGVPAGWWNTRTKRLSVYKARAKSFVSLQSNTVNPVFRLAEAGVTARCAEGVPGRGGWKKRKPFCNGTDTGCDITRPRKRADFQLVVGYERTGGTFTGGNGK